MAHVYRAHGLTVVSELPLPLPPGDPGGAEAGPDLVLRLGGERPVPHEHPPGTRVAGLTRADGRMFYSLVREGDRTVLRYPELCEFTGDREFGAVTVEPHPGVDPGLLSVLAGGTLLAVHLTLRQHLVLHASAVRVGGRALAFVGASGMGKSTLAAALCGAGHGLVADDVLRVDRTEAAMLVHPGSTESRLRVNARGLADAAPAGAVRPTADGRLALRPGTRADGPLPLAACVVPRPSREVDGVAVRRLPPSLALLRMCQFPRVLGWCDPPSMDAAFQALGDLVERVPVFEATVPWGPPFPPGVLDDLLAAVTP
ncbi:HPr serine kinase-like protein [Prauserella shujinwangii]|uniref:HPr serine kinase-like protein n=1 Tax=Prauserella shujinwangii TaxID=1453103 RepID=A0A2T0LQJ4_9PSEU|nr:hypothetical protein [Prauserella shujinwangii]PRX45626.1 HPr serine kinase-like protein [Prauserella shujinwangii]